MRLKILTVLFASAAMLASCVAPGGGGGFLFNSSTSPLLVTGNEIGTKTGKSTARCFLMLFCVGDAGILSGAKNGNITKVSSVDYKYNSFLYVVYNSTTIIVNGE